MTIAKLIERGRGQAGPWRIERNDNGTAELWHYAHRMLAWDVEQPSNPDVLDWDTGWGSVSDQNGMNTAFRVLGLPYRFDRDQRGGGARVTELVRGPDGYYARPELRAGSTR